MYAFFYLISLIYLRRTYNGSFFLILLVVFFLLNKLIWNVDSSIAGGPLSAVIFKINKVDFNLFFIVSVILSSSCWKSSKVRLPWVAFFLVFTLNVINQSSDYYTVVESSTVDVQLLNGVMSLHPFLLLATYAVLIKTSYFIFKDLNSFFFYNKNSSKLVKQGIFKKKSLITVLILNLLSLLLGAYWAVQELNWGGYWSWDPIESYSLAIVILLYTYSHSLSFNVKLPLTLLKLVFIAAMVITARSGFIESVHAFILSSSANFSLLLSLWSVTVIFFYFFLIFILLTKNPFIFKSPELMLIKVMLFVAHSLALMTLFYVITVVVVSLYSKDFVFFSENLLVLTLVFLLICGYINTYNVPIIFFNLIDAVLLNYFFFHFKVRPPLRLRHTIGLSVLVMLFNQARLSITALQPPVFDTLTLLTIKLSTISISSVESYILPIFELKTNSWKNMSYQVLTSSLISSTTEVISYVVLEPLTSLGFLEIYTSKEVNINNLSFFKPILLMSIFYFSITVSKSFYKSFFRIKRF